MSQFSGLFAELDCTYYEPNTPIEAYETDTDVKTSPIFFDILFQDRHFSETEWTVRSLDVVLGLIGGFVSLIWDSLGLLLGGYESFKFSEALTKHLYTTRSGQAQGQPTDLKSAQQDLCEGIQTRNRIEYHYREYICSWLLITLCSCCCKRLQCYRKRQKRFKRHEDT